MYFYFILFSEIIAGVLQQSQFGGSSLCEYSTADNSMAHHLNSQVGEWSRSEVNADPPSGK
jgi:hypothetical protein